MVVLPLKRQRGGKFLNPWEEPDQMNMDEVRSRGEYNVALPTNGVAPLNRRHTETCLMWQR